MHFLPSQHLFAAAERESSNTHYALGPLLFFCSLVHFIVLVSTSSMQSEMISTVDGIAVASLLLWHGVLGVYVTPTVSQGPTSTKLMFTEFRSETYDLGRSVDLTCTNKTWEEMIHTIWKLKTKRVQCTIASTYELNDYDSCIDGKVLKKSPSGGSYLQIPQFSISDEGIYDCETVYRGGSYSAQIIVSAEVPPRVSTRVEVRGGQREAVCSAAGGKPAASISWRNTWNSSVTQSSIQNSDGSFTVESRFILPDPVSAENLSCIVTHPSRREGNTEAIHTSNLGATESGGQ
ncbi:hypothetical protein JZ751_029320 [Albula glossodonta]|uniref:Ig-like domain-containing protein n=1 Tax=Albula glossodonta TaxID=121402 RepID=A0A8T2P658_9TELE|nr:hypothetical protein JZ751_029320 [Albula glossodonta]